MTERDFCQEEFQITSKNQMRMKKAAVLLMICLVVMTGKNYMIAQDVKAFPGAEGFGAYVTGGRGGDVYIVTNLDDDGPGSFREAVEASGPRTVVFAVSGTIELQSRLRIENGDLTIAGQTAPGDGICLKNYTLSLESNNLIIRYISVRLGIDKRWGGDAVSGSGSGNNIILDHCSASWGADETLSLYSSSNLTVQWCIISEGLTFTSNSYGGIWGGQPASFHHNLFAHQSSRTPRFSGSRYTNEPELEMVDHRNNVIYNWAINSCYGAEGGDYNLVNNYYKYGPATNSSRRKRIIAPRADNGANSQPEGVWGNFYVEGNYVHSFPDVTSDNWLGVEEVDDARIAMIKSDVPFDAAHVTTQSPQDAYEDVLRHAGASLPKRDRVDARITEETRSGTATYSGLYPGIINQPDDVGGYPVLESTTPPEDTDSDGIPDAWEDANGLDKNDPEDGKIIQPDGYSNLEHYLNELVGDFKYILRPMEMAAEVDDKTVNLTWTDLADNEDGFILERADGDGDYVEIASLDANVESYTDNSVTEYGTYTYRIKAYNAEMETAFTDGLQVDVVDPDPPHYTLTVQSEGSGNVIMNPDGGVYVTGTDVVLLASAAAGWEFEGWTGDVTSTDNPLTVHVDADKSITAEFSEITAIGEHKVLDGKISVFPVPFINSTTLSIKMITPGNLIVTLYDLVGRKVDGIVNKRYPAGRHDIFIDGTNLGPGSYILKVITEQEIAEKMVVRS